MDQREQKKLAIKRAEQFCKDKIVKNFNLYDVYYRVQDLILLDSQYTKVSHDGHLSRLGARWNGRFLVKACNASERVHHYKQAHWVTTYTKASYKHYSDKEIYALKSKIRKKMKSLGLDVKTMFEVYEPYNTTTTIWDLQELISKLEGPWTRYNDLEI
jgi:hypothetical protein